MTRLNRSLLLLVLFQLLLTACDDRKFIPLDVPNPHADSSRAGFKTIYAGKDSLNIVAIYAVDNITMYRLLSDWYDVADAGDFPVRISVRYYMDSTLDGGIHWAGRREVLLANENFTADNLVTNFFVQPNGQHRFITIKQGIYVSRPDSAFHLLDTALQYAPQNLHYDPKNKMAVFGYPIDKSNSESLPVNYMDGWSIRTATFDGDTLHILRNMSGTYMPRVNRGHSDSVLVMQAITSLTRTPNKPVAEINNRYTIFPEDGIGIRPGGTSRELPKFESDTKIFTVYNSADNSIQYFTDQSFLDDSIKEIHTLDASNGAWIVGTDSTRTITHLFKLKAAPPDSFSYLTSYHVGESANSIDVDLSLKKKTALGNRYTFKFYANSEFDFSRSENLIRIPQPFIPNKDSTIWTISFKPAGFNIHPGDKYRMDVYFADHIKESSYTITRKFTPTSFYAQHQKTINYTVLIGLYYLLIFLFWYFFPLQLFKANQRLPLQEITGRLPEPLKSIFSLLLLALPLSRLANSKHVLNTWAKAHFDTLQAKYQESINAEIRNKYIPIPIMAVKKPARDEILIPSPGSALVTPFTGRQQCIIQVVGDGGMGKTTLALKLVEWMVEAQQTAEIIQIPFFIDFETTDVIQAIGDKFRAWLPEEDISAPLIRGLLKYKNLVVVIDALSEESASMQQYVDTIHSTTSCNCLIVTSRKYFEFQNIGQLVLYPLALTTEKLLYFITIYLEGMKQAEPIKKSAFLATAEDQLTFASHIVQLLSNKQATDTAPPVSPMLVKMIIDNFYKDYIPDEDLRVQLSGMPLNIPDVYYGYLANMNPSRKAVDNALSGEDLFKVAELLAGLSLGENFIPRDFLKEKARKAILTELPHLKDIDPIQRLIDNTILTEKMALGSYYLRFNLDPLAEYLGAGYHFKMHGLAGDLETFAASLHPLSTDAGGFVVAFEQIVKAHG